MSTPPTPVTSPSGRAPRVCALVAVAIGVEVLLGWALGVFALTSIAPSLLATKANSAVCFILLGCSLWLLSRDDAGRIARGVAVAFALIGLAWGLLTLVEIIARVDLHIDQVLFKEAAGVAWTASPGRPPATSSLCFALVSAGLLALWTRRIIAMQMLAWGACIVGLASLLTFVLGTSRERAFGDYYTTIPLLGAVALISLAIGLFAVQPHEGLLAAVTGPLVGARTARRFAAVVVGIPLLATMLIRAGDAADLFMAEYGLVLQVTVSMVLLTLVVWFLAEWLNRDEEALRAAEARSAGEELYREMFEGHTVAMILADPETGGIVTANRGAADLFGIPAESLLNRTIAEFSCSPPDHVTAEMADAMAGFGEVFTDLCRLAGGRLRVLEVRRVPVRLRDRDLVFVILFDVTERKEAEDALRDRERKLAEAQRIAHVGSWTWDAATDIDTRSEEACRVFGRAPAEMGADPDIWLDFVHPDDRERAREVTVCAEADGRPYVVDYRVVWPDGGEHVVRECGESVLDDEGHVVTMFGTVQDITERHHADAALRDRERQLAEAQRIAHVGSWAWDAAADTMSSSKETSRIWGRPSAEMGTDPDIWFDRLHPDDRERVREVTRRAKVDGRPYEIDYCLLWPDGSEHILHERGESVLDDEGHVVTMFGTVQDITEQSRAEAALRDRERQLAEAQRIAHVGSWTWDAATDTTKRSGEAFRILGRTPAELDADVDAWLDAVHPDDRARAYEVTERAEVDGQPFEIDYRVLWPDGSEHDVRERGESVLDDQGHVLTMWGYMQDVTEQRRAEGEVRRRAEELELFNRAMVDREMRIIEMKEKVNELSRRMGEEPPYAEVWKESSRGEGGGETA